MILLSHVQQIVKRACEQCISLVMPTQKSIVVVSRRSLQALQAVLVKSCQAQILSIWLPVRDLWYRMSIYELPDRTLKAQAQLSSTCATVVNHVPQRDSRLPMPLLRQAANALRPLEAHKLQTCAQLSPVGLTRPTSASKAVNMADQLRKSCET